MNFLKEILGDGYTAFEKAVNDWNAKPENKDKQVKIADVNSGYVKKSAYDALDAAKKGLETQLQTAPDNLKKFEGIKDPAKLQSKITRLNTELTTQKETSEGQIRICSSEHLWKQQLQQLEAAMPRRSRRCSMWML